MNTCIYPIKDTYISSTEPTKNFGVDEIIRLYASNSGSTEIALKTSDWHPVPDSQTSHGENGWVAYDPSGNGFYSYQYCSGSMGWKYIILPEGNVSNSIKLTNETFRTCLTHFVDFTGCFSPILNEDNTVNIPVIINGIAEKLNGNINATVTINTPIECTGSFNGEFNGTINSGSEFTYLNINNTEYSAHDSPLTESITGGGKGIITNGSFSIICDGVLSGNISSLNFDGIIFDTSSFSSICLTNANIYASGHYSGSINPTSLPINGLIDPRFGRGLLKFDLSTIENAIKSNDIPSTAKYTLNLYCVEANNIPYAYKIYAYPVSQSWDNGIGRTHVDTEEQNYGVSWNYTNHNGGNKWYIYDTTNPRQKIDYFNNPEYVTESFKFGGGTWYPINPVTSESLQCVQSFDFSKNGDIAIDVTKIVSSWINGNIPNEGFILMLSTETEDSKPLPKNVTNTQLAFFSKETNTIYSPSLQISWDDSIFETGDLDPIDYNNEILVELTNLNETYACGEFVYIKIFARQKYSYKSFRKLPQQEYMVTPQYLPKDSFYMIKDAESGRIIYDFDDSTRICCNPYFGNYFVFDTTGLVQERYYKIILKVCYDNGSIRFYDTKKIFKIIR